MNTLTYIPLVQNVYLQYNKYYHIGTLLTNDVYTYVFIVLLMQTRRYAW